MRQGGRRLAINQLGARGRDSRGVVARKDDLAAFLAFGLSHAQAHRHCLHHDHRRRPDRHRPGVRVRLLRRPGLQGPQGRGLSRHPGELQPRHHHDRPRPGRRHLYRADYPGDRRKDHRPGKARRPAAHHGRSDGAEHGHAACPQRRAATPQCRTHRRPCRGDRPRRRPSEIPRRHGGDRHRIALLRHRPHDGRSPRSTGDNRAARGHPPILHTRRHRRRHRL